MLIEQDIADVVVGCYVEAIIAQQGNYKLTSGQWIANEQVISKLKALGIQRLLIDSDKFRNSARDETAVSTATISAITDSAADTDANVAFNARMAQAKTFFVTAKQVQKKLFSNIVNGTKVDIDSTKYLLADSIEVLFANPDALVCAINLRNKDDYLFEHSFSVAILMTLFARYMGIDKAVVHELAVGAFLHDVGKIKIPEHILNKPGKLSTAEFAIMKMHVNHSIDIIESIPNIAPLSLKIAAHHHEQLNLQGYPYGLSGDKICQYSRMLSICDIYDALTTNRSYKEGYSQIKAFTILRTLAEKGQIDGTLVNAFIKCMGVYPVGSLVRLNDDRLAIVEHYNQHDPVRPKVNVFYDLNKKAFATATLIDLSCADDNIEQSVRPDDYDLDMNQIMEFLTEQG